MTVTATPIFPQAVTLSAAPLLSTTGAYTFAPGNTVTNLVVLKTAGTNGSKIEAINVTSTETANNRDLILLVLIGTNLHPITVVSIPLNSGFTNSVPPINLLGAASQTQLPGLSYDSAGNKY